MKFKTVVLKSVFHFCCSFYSWNSSPPSASPPRGIKQNVRFWWLRAWWWWWRTRQWRQRRQRVATPHARTFYNIFLGSLSNQHFANFHFAFIVCFSLNYKVTITIVFTSCHLKRLESSVGWQRIQRNEMFSNYTLLANDYE